MFDMTFNKIVVECFGEVVNYVKEEGLDVSEVSIGVLKQELLDLYNNIEESDVSKEETLWNMLSDYSGEDLYDLSMC